MSALPWNTIRRGASGPAPPRRDGRSIAPWPPIAAKADTVAQKRFEVALSRYVIGRIAPDNLFLAQNEKDQATTAYVQAQRAYWAAYYTLRKVTLYDFEAGRPLVP